MPSDQPTGRDPRQGSSDHLNAPGARSAGYTRDARPLGVAQARHGGRIRPGAARHDMPEPAPASRVQPKPRSQTALYIGLVLVGGLGVVAIVMWIGAV